eukprot:CAMPEP_0178992480 /NCGR_PEP_ID=MMETSP0795-20121207/6137_1 /TAXON_ID=88552 /ORGANISM="Amoebophrya sp., Strain Ameob2" /LENGTH=241 /DNA_ID=CAMNT_0020684365 /DNA_START=114 /DNA_END=839 /DNA_ORIENTATION=-
MEEEGVPMEMGGNPNIGTYPYVVVKGVPTYETDYQGFGQKQMTFDKIQRVEDDQIAAESARTQRLRQKAKPKERRDLAVYTGRPKRTANGEIVERPPLSRSTSVQNLGEISFTGINFKKPSAMTLANFKKGKRLSMCWDNVASYGSDCWVTTNGDFGSVVQPSVLKQKRFGSKSFENSRFLPDHPHWKDRPYKPGEYIKCPRSTYSDLGSFYVDGYRLPPEYQYTLTKRRTVDADNGNPVM